MKILNKKIIAIISIVLVLVVVFCGGYFLRDISLKSTKKESDTKNTTDTAKVKLDNEFVYDWLLENGELVDSTELVYSINKEDGSSLTIATDTSKAIGITYTFKENNYQITCGMGMFGGNKHSFSCKVVDESSTGKENSYTFKKNSFNRNTPLSGKKHVNWYIDGDTIQSLIWKGGKCVQEVYSASKGGSVDKEIPKEKVEKARTADEIITKDAQKYLCALLVVMEKDLCPLLEIDMKDLGYMSFSK